MDVKKPQRVRPSFTFFGAVTPVQKSIFFENFLMSPKGPPSFFFAISQQTSFFLIFCTRLLLFSKRAKIHAWNKRKLYKKAYFSTQIFSATNEISNF